MKNNLASLSLKKTSALFQAGILAFAAMLPLVALVSPASAAGQLFNRYIDLSGNLTSDGSGRDGTDTAGQDVTYRVGFDVETAHANIEAIVLDFCDSPLVGTACTAPTGFDVNEGTVAVTAVAGITGTWTKHANTDTNTLILTKTAGDTLAADDTVTFDLGTAAAADGITNPTSPGSFYARIVTYDDETFADDYTSLDPDVTGAHIDEGGIAMAIANELTITARVQEVLQFCVGTTDSGATSDCTDISGTAVDLGIVDSSVVNDTTASPAFAMVRTNAYYGASVYYKAEQNATYGKLKIAGAACTNNTSELDRCFNSAIGSGTTAAPVSQEINAGTEGFGMTLTGVDVTNGGATGNLSRDAAYDGDGTTGSATACTAADAGTNQSCWAWADAGSFDTIASSSSVLDDEMVTIAFAATAAPTTPTGLYSVTANFVATATF